MVWNANTSELLRDTAEEFRAPPFCIAERNLMYNPSGTDGLEGWRVATRKFAILKNNNIRSGYRWSVERLLPAQGARLFMSTLSILESSWSYIDGDIYVSFRSISTRWESGQ